MRYTTARLDPMRPLKVGVQLPEVERRVDWPELVAMARRAEDAGFDSLWLGDHLLYDLPGGLTRGPWEAWTSLAAVAAVTERVELGPFVASTSFHSPAMLAKMAATVDGISGGRLLLGLGAGWNAREYAAFGFPFDARVSRFEEAFTIIRELVREGRSDFHGRYHDVTDCVLDPPPTRPGGPPLMIGSTGPRMLRHHPAARRPLEHLVERLRQHRRRLRRASGPGSRRRLPPRAAPRARSAPPRPCSSASRTVGAA